MIFSQRTFFFVVLLLSSVLPANAVTLSLVSTQSNSTPGDTITIAINVDDAEGLCGCTFSLAYPSDVVVPHDSPFVSTQFFNTIIDQRNPTVTASLEPWLSNSETPGMVKLSGAYILMDPETGGGGAYSGAQTLFTLSFKIKADAVDGQYQFQLQQTPLCNGPAGWGEDKNNNGEYDPDQGDIQDFAPLLVKSYNKTSPLWGTPEQFEILLESFTIPPTLSFVVAVPDSDNDGLPDSLEDTTCTDALVADSDNDGLSDGDEDINQNGIPDPGETDPCNKDSDLDGMPDGWEKNNSLSPLVKDAHGDIDNDGFSNMREFLAGTLPNDDTSVPFYLTETEDFESGSLDEYHWIAIGPTPWIVSSDNVLNGSYSCKSPQLDYGQSALLELNRFCDAGDISFFHAIDFTGSAAALSFYIDDIFMDQWSASTAFANASYWVSQGMHNFRWVIDASHINDQVWIDTIIFPGTTDTDTDDLPDAWELEYCLDGLSLAPGNDDDLDMFDNLKEYFCGTDPVNQNDRPGMNTGFEHVDIDMDGSDLQLFINKLMQGHATEDDLKELALEFGK